MFLNWKNQYCQNDCSTQGNLQIQCSSNGIYHRTRTKMFYICMDIHRTSNSQSNLRKKNRWRSQAPLARNIPQSYKNRNINQRNRIESLEIIPHSYGQLINGKGGKTTQWRKDSLFDNQCWGNWTATCKRMKLEHSLNTIHKNKLKMDRKPKCKARHYKILIGKYRKNTLWHNLQQYLFQSISYYWKF